MRVNDLFAIDVVAELATLCDAQLQGPWQVPTEIVRLAVARGGAMVEIEHRRGWFLFRCDGVLASCDELLDLVAVFDPDAGTLRRQEAISRIEGLGLSALLWAAGLPGAALSLRSRTGGRLVKLDARKGRLVLGNDEADPGPPLTTIRWRCRGAGRGRAVAWMRTALRFVPIPVTVCGTPVERGFRDGLYRMRITEPLCGEIAVTAAGDAPTLWLLDHGVLSARAVVPGYPAFSAALEMSDVLVPSSADELRSAVNPHLERLIDQAGRMLLLLVDRLPEAEEHVRARLTTLLLRWALHGLRRDQIMAAPVIGVREKGARTFRSPSELARIAAKSGGVLRAVEPGSVAEPNSDATLLEVVTEELSLVSELLNIRIEAVGGAKRWRLGARLRAPLGRLWRGLRGLIGRKALDGSRLTGDEVNLIEVAASAGVELALAPGSGAVRQRRSTRILSRDRAGVRRAASAVALDATWIYPALLAVGDEDLEIPDELRRRWIESLLADPTRAGGDFAS